MHIFLWGFLVVALNNLHLASPSDKVKNHGRDEANKSQLDMILAQLQRKHDKLQQQQDEQKKEQQLMNEVLRDQIREEQLVNEVLRDQIQEQKHKNDEHEREMKEQRRKNDKQERKIKELTKIKRDRRSDGDIEDHLKEFILNETKSLKQSILNETYALIDGLTQCEIGTSSTASFPSTPTTISFARNFTRKPNVVVAVTGFKKRTTGSFKLFVQKITTTKFEIYGYKYSSGSFGWVDSSWIACA